MDSEYLISEVFLKKSLWNVTDKDYYNRRVAGKLWESVAENMGSSVDECKKKWKGLRDRFRVELKKELAASKYDSEGKNWTSSWLYFNVMSFLRKHMSPSDTSGNLQLGDASSPRSTVNEEMYDVHDEIILEPMLDQDLSQGKQDNAGKNRKRKITDDFRNKFLELEEKKTKFLHEMGKTMYKEEKESEDLLFFKSLLGYMENLPPMSKLRIRNKVTSAIMDELALHSRMSTPFSWEYSSAAPPQLMYAGTSDRPSPSVKPESGVNDYTLNPTHSVNSSLNRNEENANTGNNLLTLNDTFS